MTRKHFQPLHRLILIGFVAVVGGCHFPEQFQADMKIAKDGSYVFRYAGSIVNGLAALEIAERASLSASDEIGYKHEAESLKKQPGVITAIYLGYGRYQYALTQSRKVNEALTVLDFFSSKKNRDGSTTVATTRVDSKALADLNRMNISPTGNFDLALPANAKVIAHNATAVTASTEPLKYGSNYHWSIAGFAQPISITYQLHKN